MPELRLQHLSELTDDTGIVQHANFDIPNRAEGYCTDDNARALLFTAYLESVTPQTPALSALQSRYLAFVAHAYNDPAGRFRNFMSYSRCWLEEVGSEDSQGRALWSLGSVVNRCHNRDRRELATVLFDRSLISVREAQSLRTWAFGVLAAEEYLQSGAPNDNVRLLQRVLGERLWKSWLWNRGDRWPWFEPILSYDNARISQALILAAFDAEQSEMLAAGLESLEWLMRIQSGPKGEFAAIGSNGFYPRGGKRAHFDQQPIEAWASVSACLTAHRITHEAKWMSEAKRAFRWFLGENMLGKPVCDEATGGCSDGLHSDRVNRNQGAESTLAYLCSQVELAEAEQRAGFEQIAANRFRVL